MVHDICETELLHVYTNYVRSPLVLSATDSRLLACCLAVLGFNAQPIV